MGLDSGLDLGLHQVLHWLPGIDQANGLGYKLES